MTDWITHNKQVADKTAYSHIASCSPPDWRHGRPLPFVCDPDLPTIFAAPFDELLTIAYGHQLAIRLKESGLSRLGGAGWLTTTINSYGGAVCDANGCELRRYDDFLERAYGNELSFSWHTDYKRFADDPPRQRPQDRLAARFELWDVAFKIDGRPIEIFW